MSEFTYEKIEFKVSMRDVDGNEYKETVSPAYLVGGTGLDWIELVVHRHLQFPKNWEVSDRSSGCAFKTSAHGITTRDEAVKFVILSVKRIGQKAYEKQTKQAKKRVEGLTEKGG